MAGMMSDRSESFFYVEVAVMANAHTAAGSCLAKPYRRKGSKGTLSPDSLSDSIPVGSAMPVSSVPRRKERVKNCLDGSNSHRGHIPLKFVLELVSSV